MNSKPSLLCCHAITQPLFLYSTAACCPGIVHASAVRTTPACIRRVILPPISACVQAPPAASHLNG
jgi:hypothetical protein